MLTIGIIMAAMADAQSKVHPPLSPMPNQRLISLLQGKTSSSSAFTIDPEFMTGLLILFIAQLLSAIMGLYTQLTYAKYGSHWHENLFYSHFLSIPLFLPFFPSLLIQFKILLSSPHISLTPFLNSPSILLPKSAAEQPGRDFQLPPILSTPGTPSIPIPKHILTLGLNALTQFACIRGVNLLGARTTALGVSIVLNLRKLVSLFASIWLFGNTLPPGVVAGAVVVFSSAGIWAWEGQRISAREKEGKKKGRVK
jgi:UDP-xylose/UDP-N-acetylglucosamine transporter B4